MLPDPRFVDRQRETTDNSPRKLTTTDVEAERHRYIHAAANDDLERERLELLASLHDPLSRRQLADALDLDGTDVLEFGAGTGSIARWLGDEVGPDGRVLATDIDPRFLTRLGHPRVDVQVHDIVTDPLEPNRFDLIHGRFVLTHLPNDADKILGRLVDSLKPGGCLVIEEIDVGTLRVADRYHPSADKFDRARAHITASLRTIGAQDPEFGLTLPGRFRSTELTDIRSWVDYEVHPPTSDYHRFLELSVESATTGLNDLPGFDPADWAPLLDTIRTPDRELVGMAVVGILGYRA